jgi:hypothetical protein
MAKQEEMNKDEQIGFHKGAVNTLVAERNELIRLAQITESLLKAHLKALEELGVKIEQRKEKSEVK